MQTHVVHAGARRFGVPARDTDLSYLSTNYIRAPLHLNYCINNESNNNNNNNTTNDLCKLIKTIGKYKFICTFLF